MKTIRYTRYFMLSTLLLWISTLLHAQVIRIDGNGKMIITGEARIVMNNANLANEGHIGNHKFPLVFNGSSEKTTLLADTNVREALFCLILT